MSSYRLFIAVFAALIAVAVATNCWKISITVYYNVGPATVQLSHREAVSIMTQVLNVATRKLAPCSGLFLILEAVAMSTPSNNYVITGRYGVLYYNMDSSQKQAAFTCLLQQQIYLDVILNPSIYIPPLGGVYYPDRAVQSNPNDTTCATNVSVIVANVSTGVVQTSMVYMNISRTSTTLLSSTSLSSSPSPQTPSSSISSSSPQPTSSPISPSLTQPSPSLASSQSPSLLPWSSSSTTPSWTSYSPSTSQGLSRTFTWPPRNATTLITSSRASPLPTVSTTTSIPVTTIPPLSFVNFISTRGVPLDDRLITGCEVTTGTINIAWKRNGNVVLSNDNSRAVNLTINKVKTTDAGEYICEAKNEYQVISRSFQLNVYVLQEVEMSLALRKMSIYIQHELLYEIYNILRTNMANTSSVVSINSLRNVSSAWVAILTIRVTKVLTLPQDSPPDLISPVNTLMIKHVKQGSFRNLTVEPTSLVIRVKPPPPTTLDITERGTTSITLSWLPPYGWECYQIEQYIVRMRKQDQNDWTITLVDNDVKYNKFVELKTNTRYEFEIASRGSMGDGKPSNIITGVTLTVEPIIANDGQNFTVKVGESVVLVCQGSSDPRPERVTWTKIPPGSAISTNVTGNGKIVNAYMVLRDVTVEDSGPYPCTATHGDVTVQGAVNLVVEVPVAVNMNVTLANRNFTEDLKNKSTPQFKKLEKRIVTSLVELYKNITGFQGVEIIEFIRGSVKVRFRVIVVVKIPKPTAQVKQSQAQVDVTNLIIQKVRKTNGNLGNGLIVKPGSIETDAIPNAPRNVTIHDIKENKAHLRWSKPQYAEEYSVTHYIVHLKQHGQNWQEKVKTRSVQLDCPLNDLQDNTAYYVKVLARNQQGNGLDSEHEEFKTRAITTSLLWLWILLPILGVLLVAGLVFCMMRKSSQRMDRLEWARPAKAADDVHLFSYKNKAFSPSSLDLDSLGIMPGKWWEIPRNSLHIQETLGSGQFGTVLKAQLKSDGGFHACAVKTLKETASQEDQRELFQELQLMNSIGRHNNLVNLIGACSRDGPLMIVLEFAEKGSLFEYLRNNVTTVDGESVCSLSECKKLNISYDIAKGMQYLASVKCIHRDLAARNVLLTGDGEAKIADFGLSRDAYERGFYQKTTQGKLPARWMAPEAIETMKFSTQTDVWSYGVVLWEIETGGKKPYGSMEAKYFVTHLKKGHRLPRPITCKEKIYDVMLHCWHINQEGRPSFNDLCIRIERFLNDY